MEFTRIRSYTKEGKFTGCEHIYARDKQKALEWFLRDYPAHKECIVVAEDYNPYEDPGHFRACANCGCVHYYN